LIIAGITGTGESGSDKESTGEWRAGLGGRAKRGQKSLIMELKMGRAWEISRARESAKIALGR
jgi:hypothetical protein